MIKKDVPEVLFALMDTHQFNTGLENQLSTKTRQVEHKHMNEARCDYWSDVHVVNWKGCAPPNGMQIERLLKSSLLQDKQCEFKCI